MALVKEPPERRLVSVGEALQEAVGARPASGLGDRDSVVDRADIAEPDVLTCRELVAHEVLEDHRDPAAQLVGVTAGQLPPIPGDRPRRGVIETAEQLYERGLARPVLADERHRLPACDLHRDPLEHREFRLGVAEGQIRHGHPRQGTRGWPGRGRSHLCRRELEEGPEVLHEEGVLVQQPGRHDEHPQPGHEEKQRTDPRGHLTQGDLVREVQPQDDQHAGCVHRRARERGEELATQPPPDQLAQLCGLAVEQALLLSEQVGAEAEGTGLLRRLARGEDALEVSDEPSVRRVADRVPVEVPSARDVRRPQRDQGRHEQADKGGMHGEEHHRQPHHRDARAHDERQVGDHVPRAKRRLPLGAHEPVVKGGSLEGRQVKGDRLAREHRLGRLTNELGKQPLPLLGGGRYEATDRQRTERDGHGRECALHPFARTTGREHLVQRPLPGQNLCGKGEARQGLKAQQGDRFRRARAPHEPQGRSEKADQPFQSETTLVAFTPIGGLRSHGSTLARRRSRRARRGPVAAYDHRWDEAVLVQPQAPSRGGPPCRRASFFAIASE